MRYTRFEKSRNFSGQFQFRNIFKMEGRRIFPSRKVLFSEQQVLDNVLDDESVSDFSSSDSDSDESYVPSVNDSDSDQAGQDVGPTYSACPSQPSACSRPTLGPKRSRLTPRDESEWSPTEVGAQTNTNYRFLPKKEPGINGELITGQSDQLDCFFYSSGRQHCGKTCAVDQRLCCYEDTD